MIPVSADMASFLASQYRQPFVCIEVLYPDPNDNTKVGASLILDGSNGLMSVTIQRNEEPSSDTMDFEVANGNSAFSPNIEAAPQGLYHAQGGFNI